MGGLPSLRSKPSAAQDRHAAGSQQGLSQDGSMPPFRFAVQTQNAAGRAEWQQRARDAESMGYSTLLVPDHFTEQWGALVALTAAAEATERLRIGALVFDNDFRHPMELAKEAATLDVLYPGRLEFGLGAGWMKTDYEQS